jgi:4-hydroxy-4-methyl-2-oxoglutarate aldolase
MISPALLARWNNITSAIAADVSAGACVIDPAIRPLMPPGQQPKLFGRAITASCAPPDFGSVLRALDLAKPGDVLVIDAKGRSDHAMIGGILGGFLHRRGAAGIVCNGAVRDVAELASFKNFAVFSRYICARGPSSAHGNAVNVMLEDHGFSVRPGDLIIGDDDGAVTISPVQAIALIDACEAKQALENQWQSALRKGAAVAEVFGTGNGP